METIGYQAIDRIYEWLLGSLIIGPLAGLLTGLFIFIMAVIIKKRKKWNRS